jgi:uncharacterized OB-fold protein
MTDVLGRPAAAQRPVPVVDESTAPYWEAARREILAILRCSDCGRRRNPPSPVCPGCFSEAAEWQPVSGRGTVHQFTILRQPRVRGFEGAVPYAVVVVELDEQPMLLFVANLVGVDAGAARIGMRVQVTFEHHDDFVLPQFTPLP